MKQLFIFLFCFFFYVNLQAQKNGVLNEADLNNLIESNFIKNETPLRYYSNLLIQLQGIPTKEDSTIFQELVDTLNLLINKWDVYLIPEGTSNLIFEINPLEDSKKDSPFNDVRKNLREIIKSNIVIRGLSEGTNSELRKKIIRYHLLRSLVAFTFDSNLVEKAPGSVFAVSEPVKITFNPIDFQIIKKVYSQEYDDKLQPSSGLPPSLTINRKQRMLQLVGSLMGFLLSTSFLLLFFFLGHFQNHNYNFWIFLKQGLLVLISCLIYVGVVIVFSSPYARMEPKMWIGIVTSIVSIFALGMLAIVLIFFSERAILKGSDFYIMEIIFPMMTISIIPTILVLIITQLLAKSYFKPDPTSVLNLMLVALSVTLYIAVIRAIFIFLNKKSENIIRKKDLELAKMGELQKQAELQSIRSKINPHFLYNSLNSIASLANSDSQKTEKMALALSDFFKYSINREQKQFNSLEEELNAVRTYLEIEKVRFGDRLNFEIDCSAKLLEIQIPQLLIQPLVENAIKHGLSKITENGFLKIEIVQENRMLNIKIFDNGPDFLSGPLTGFGIRNTSERIELIYGSRASINWQNGAEKFIMISLPDLKK